ncbi:hypothetical protein [Piscirickettsia litoralis]|uniref:Uncharacterized protein n=1 Tax=Piscirickettsia litoralis TaxID=1891921 RepID=A0ABX3A075_9GAMM|nr:hypothetical protein [Piscirickettsia litoralis]ODN42271.1 hypothetical protein BGC07_04135 [Piscirickettsia litoralis]
MEGYAKGPIDRDLLEKRLSDKDSSANMKYEAALLLELIDNGTKIYGIEPKKQNELTSSKTMQHAAFMTLVRECLDEMKADHPELTEIEIEKLWGSIKKLEKESIGSCCWSKEPKDSEEFQNLAIAEIGNFQLESRIRLKNNKKFADIAKAYLQDDEKAVMIVGSDHLQDQDGIPSVQSEIAKNNGSVMELNLDSDSDCFKYEKQSDSDNSSKISKNNIQIAPDLPRTQQEIEKLDQLVRTQTPEKVSISSIFFNLFTTSSENTSAPAIKKSM